MCVLTVPHTVPEAAAGLKPNPLERARSLLRATLAGFLVVANALVACRNEPPAPFTIIVLPDTQYYSARHPEIFLEQTKWIRENKEALNVACVIHEGDLTDDNHRRQWQVADQAMSVLDDCVPYCVTTGNHDFPPEAGSERDTERFNRRFGHSRFDNKPWYGGHFDASNENAFYLIDASGMHFLVVCLEFGPRDEVLQWANQVVASHKSRRTIVNTHCYMYSDNTRVGPGDSWSHRDYLRDGNDGEQIWEKFVRRHKNIFLVLSGHVLNSGLGRLTSKGRHGNQVHQLLANYQMQENGGNGWLRILKFLPAENKIAVTTYSPFLKLYARDDQNQFELDYPMN